MDSSDLADDLAATFDRLGIGKQIGERELEIAFNEVEGKDALRQFLEVLGGKRLSEVLLEHPDKFISCGLGKWRIRSDRTQQDILKIMGAPKKGSRGGRGGGGGGGNSSGRGRGAIRGNNIPRVHQTANGNGFRPAPNRGQPPRNPIGNYGSAFRRQPTQPPPPTQSNLSNNRPLSHRDAPNYGVDRQQNFDNNYDSRDNDNSYNSWGNDGNQRYDDRGYNQNRFPSPPRRQSPPRRPSPPRGPSPNRRLSSPGRYSPRRPYTPDEQRYQRRERSPSPYRDNFQSRGMDYNQQYRRRDSFSPPRNPSPPRRQYDDYRDDRGRVPSPSRNSNRPYSPENVATHSGYGVVRNERPSQRSYDNRRSDDRSPPRTNRNAGQDEVYKKPLRSERINRLTDKPVQGSIQLTENDISKIFGAASISATASSSNANDPEWKLAEICADIMKDKTNGYDVDDFFYDVEAINKGMFPGGNFPGKVNYLLSLKKRFPDLLGAIKLDENTVNWDRTASPAPSNFTAVSDFHQSPLDLSRPPGLPSPVPDRRAAVSPPPGLNYSQLPYQTNKRVNDEKSEEFRQIRSFLMFSAPENINVKALNLELQADLGFTAEETLENLTYLIFVYFKGKYQTVVSGDTNSVQLSPRHNRLNQPNFFRTSTLHALLRRPQATDGLGVEVVNFTSFQKFSVRLVKDDPLFNKINNDIQSMFADTNTAASYNVSRTDLKVGHAVICFLAADFGDMEKYHRAMVVQSGDVEVKVLLLDVGKVKIMTDRVYAMPAQYDTVPPFAINCSYDIKDASSFDRKRCSTALKGGSVENFSISFGAEDVVTNKEGNSKIINVDLLVSRNGSLVPFFHQ